MKRLAGVARQHAHESFSVPDESVASRLSSRAADIVFSLVELSEGELGASSESSGSEDLFRRPSPT